MDPHFWRWAAPWPLFALLFAAAAVVVARRARARASATLWLATTAALSALYTVALTRAPG